MDGSFGNDNQNTYGGGNDSQPQSGSFDNTQQSGSYGSYGNTQQSGNYGSYGNTQQSGNYGSYGNTQSPYGQNAGNNSGSGSFYQDNTQNQSAFQSGSNNNQSAYQDYGSNNQSGYQDYNNQGSYQYQNYTTSANQSEDASGLAVVSLVMGILSIVSSCCYGFGIIFGIAGCICAAVANKKMSSGIGKAGLITSIIGTVFSALMIAVVVLAVFGYIAEYGL